MSPANDWNPSVWITLAGLFITMLGAIVLGAFYAGVISNRVDKLEDGHKKLVDDVRMTRDEASKARELQAGQTATLLALANKVDAGFEEMKQTIRDTMSSRRRRGPDDIG